MSAPSLSDYRLAPALAARLTGVALIGVALLVFGGTLVVAFSGLPFGAVLAVALAGVCAVVALFWWIGRRVRVLRLDELGYRVRLVRGAGVTRARWTEVKDMVTTTVLGEPCVVLRLRDGRRTTIPVRAVASDPDELVRDLQRFLQRGHGLRRL